MLQRLKSLTTKRKPSNLPQADRQGSDTFFDAVLKFCALPTTPASTSFSGYEYESTPEPLGHPDPRGLHRRPSATPAAPESVYYDADGEPVHREKKAKEGLGLGQQEWPTRSSSIEGSQRYANNYTALIEIEPVKRKHSPFSLASVEPYDGPPIEDSYDYYSEQRHDMDGNQGLWPRLRRSAEEPLRRKRPRQDDDRSPPSHWREDAFNTPKPTPTPTPPSPVVKFKESVPFKSHPIAEPALQSRSDFPTITPSTIGLIPRALFSQDQPSSRWSHPDLDSNADAGSISSSKYSLTFENSSIFRPRGGTEDRDRPPLAPLSPWRHTSTSSRPPFKNERLEAYRLADPSLLRNVGQPIPKNPYLHLSWETLSKQEYLLALGHCALAQGYQLPPIYAARPIAGKEWAEEDSVAVVVETFNEMVEEMCKAELETMERIYERDGWLRKEFGLDDAWRRRTDDEGLLDGECCQDVKVPSIKRVLAGEPRE